MHFYTAYGLTISSEIELPELLPIAPDTLCDVRIKKGHIDLPPLTKTSLHRRGVMAKFAQTEGKLYLSWDGVADFEAVEGHTLMVSPYTADSSVISLFTVSEAFGLLLFQRGYYLLHASSVAVGEVAFCFMGRPGAGKSSTAAAFLKAGASLLSDDLTAIKFDESGQPFVIPAYPQLKIWNGAVEGLAYDSDQVSPVSEGVNKFAYHPVEDFPVEPTRLTRIFFLHKARNQPVERALSAMEIPTEMLKHFPLPSRLLSEDLLKRHFLDSFKCSQASEVRVKRRPEGFEKLKHWVDAQIAATSTSSL